MYKNPLNRNGSIHLYDPKKEGLGPYDVHYINAHRKEIKIKNSEEGNSNQRYAA